MTNFFKSLRPASLRGVSFMVETDDKSGSRRIVRHQYPGRDAPFHEDLGAGADEFTVDAIVAGAGFVSAADRLEAAIRRPGAARLIHPHFGEVEVVVMSYRRMHSTSQTGEVRFSISMEKNGVSKFPTSVSNTASGLLSSSLAAFSAAVSDFNTYFVSSGLPDFLAADAQGRSDLILGRLKTLLDQNGVLRNVTTAWPVLSVITGSFASDLTGLYQNLVSLIAPARKPVIGKSSTVSIPSAKSLIRAVIDATGESLSVGASTSLTSAATRSSNAQSLDFIHSLSSLGAGVGSVRHASFDSREEAVAIRDQLADRLSNLRDRLGSAGWDDSWTQAGQLQAALNRDIDERLGRLPRTVEIQSGAMRPSLVLANRLYGDVPSTLIDRAGDIVQRNSVRHPGFVPAAKLEVLIDA